MMCKSYIIVYTTLVHKLLIAKSLRKSQGEHVNGAIISRDWRSIEIMELKWHAQCSLRVFDLVFPRNNEWLCWKYETVSTLSPRSFPYYICFIYALATLRLFVDKFPTFLLIILYSILDYVNYNLVQYSLTITKILFDDNYVATTLFIKYHP